MEIQHYLSMGNFMIEPVSESIHLVGGAVYFMGFQVFQMAEYLLAGIICKNSMFDIFSSFCNVFYIPSHQKRMKKRNPQTLTNGSKTPNPDPPHKPNPGPKSHQKPRTLNPTKSFQPTQTLKHHQKQ